MGFLSNGAPRVRVLSSRKSVAGKWPVSFLSKALIHYTITFAVLAHLLLLPVGGESALTRSVCLSGTCPVPCVKAPATSGTLHEAAASCWSNYEHFE